MKELLIKYGCNPNQKPSKLYMDDGSELPVEILNGNPGYINFLDAFNGWQLVKEMKEATGYPAAASFKHVSPAGAAVGLPLTDVLRKIYFVPEGLELSPLASAYARARGSDRMSSFGDFITLSDRCDEATAQLIKGEVSDGVIAPDYTQGALDILKSKRGGKYTVIKIDGAYIPCPVEKKQVYGVSFEQGRNDFKVTEDCFKNIPTSSKTLTDGAKLDMTIALITLKYTQSNSVCYAYGGQTIGVGAGQQSRIHCTRLAGNKADLWWLRQHPKTLGLKFKEGLGRPERDNAIDNYLGDNPEDVLSECVWRSLFSEKPQPLTAEEKSEFLKSVSGVTLGSDAFFPFGDNIERAARSGVSFVSQPGGSIRDDNVIAACDKYGITMCFTGARLFHH